MITTAATPSICSGKPSRQPRRFRAFGPHVNVGVSTSHRALSEGRRLHLPDQQTPISDCPFALRHFAPVIAERRARDLPRYFQAVGHAHTVPEAEVAALFPPTRIHPFLSTLDGRRFSATWSFPTDLCPAAAACSKAPFALIKSRFR